MPKGTYTAKIERRLAQLVINPMTIAAYRFGGHFDVTKEFTAVGADGKSGKFTLAAMRYNPVGQICDLCGHNPINRIFGIKAIKTGEVLEVGSECIKNWVGADIAAGLAKILDSNKNAIINEERLANEIAALKKVLEDPASRAYDKRTAQQILRRISEGNANPILDSGRKLVAKALRAAGYEVPMVPRFGKLLKDTKKSYQAVKEVYDRMEAYLYSIPYNDRYNKDKVDQRYTWRLRSEMRDIIRAYESAEAFYNETGVITAADGKILRQLVPGKGKRVGILETISVF